MACEVLGSGAERDLGFKYLEADLRPLAYGFKSDAAIDEGVREISPVGAKSVGANYHRTRCFVAVEEGEGELPRMLPIVRLKVS